MDRSTVARIARRPDAAKIRRWRFDRLVEAGYDAATASLLGDRPEIDLHAAMDLVANGCPPATAVRILV